MNRCHERDGRGQRCTVEGEHRQITNSRGQLALAHETKTSMWSTPVSRLITAIAAPAPRGDVR